MTSTVPSQPNKGDPETRIKHRTAWIGLITGVVALATAVSLLVNATLQKASAQQSADQAQAQVSVLQSKLASANAALNSVAETQPGPPMVTITPPGSGQIHWIDSYKGDVKNLQAGQLVWTFNQAVNSHSLYPDTGPCNVDYVHQQWTCDNIYVGGQSDTGLFRVCVTILSAAQAFQAVDHLRSGTLYPQPDPPTVDVKSFACMIVARTK